MNTIVYPRKELTSKKVDTVGIAGIFHQIILNTASGCTIKKLWHNFKNSFYNDFRFLALWRTSLFFLIIGGLLIKIRTCTLRANKLSYVLSPSFTYLSYKSKNSTKNEGKDKKSCLWSDEEQGLKYRLHSSILKLNLRNLKVLWRLEKEENGQ
jgi:hypothetical protein